MKPSLDAQVYFLYSGIMEHTIATHAFATLGHPGRLAVFRLLMRFAPQGVRPTEIAQALDLKPVQFDEAGFRFALNEDAMATEKLAEGIRAFAADAIKLDQLMLAV